MAADYDDYQDGAIKLFKQLFGTKMYNKLKNTELKRLIYNGPDVTTSSITVVCPNIKQRFDVEPYEDDVAIEKFILSVFHMGYQACCDYEVEKIEKKYELAYENNELLREVSSLQREEIAELKDKLNEK